MLFKDDFNQAPSRRRRLWSDVSMEPGTKWERPTVETSVIRLDESLLDLSILNEQDVALAAVVTEDGAAVEAEVERLGELAGWVSQEANLQKEKSD